MLRPKVITVKPLNDYKLFLSFDTGEQRIFDVLPYIDGEWYGKLLDQSVFATVHIAGHTVEWVDGQDIAPHELYDLSVPVHSSPNQETIQAIDDVNNHRNMSRKFSSIEELMQDLNA